MLPLSSTTQFAFTFFFNMYTFTEYHEEKKKERRFPSCSFYVLNLVKSADLACWGSGICKLIVGVVHDTLCGFLPVIGT